MNLVETGSGAHIRGPNWRDRFDLRMTCADQSGMFMWAEGAVGENPCLWPGQKRGRAHTEEQEGAVGDTGAPHFDGRKPLALECIGKNIEHSLFLTLEMHVFPHYDTGLYHVH